VSSVEVDGGAKSGMREAILPRQILAGIS